MLVPINIDTSGFQEAFSISQEDIKQFTSNVVSELAVELSRHWTKQADVLKSSRQDYQNSIYVNKIDDLSYEVGLVGWLPNAIESGISGFDMKANFEKSSKRTMTEDGGWYLTIPYRQASSEAIGESSVFSGVMPSEVHKEAKKLSTGEGLSVKKLPEQYQIPKIRTKVVTESKIFEEYQNKHSIYAGLQKKQDVLGRGTYTGFRRVSGNSDGNAWIHPGIEEHGFAEKALETMDFEATIDNLANKFIEQL